MNFRETRDQIIAQNVPKLIKSLLGIEESDGNFKNCVDFAFSHISNTKYPSVNSHEIRRQIDGLAERFEISNYKQYGDRLKELCQSFCLHPICKDHSETDIEWSILSFLLNTSCNPIAGVSENDPNMIFLLSTKESSPDDKHDDNLSSKESSFREQEFSDSDLSIWSDDEDDESNNAHFIKINNEMQIHESNWECESRGFQRPQKPCHFALLNTNSSFISTKLFSEIQHHWWNDPNYIYPSVTEFGTANYCHFWNLHTNMVKISTISEYCLIREILFMFLTPTNCKFFRIVSDTVLVNDLVSLNSVSLSVIQSFLNEFCQPITLMHRLRTFCYSVKHPVKGRPPHTYECFVEGMQECMRPFNNFVLNKEKEVNELGQLVHPVTIANLMNDMREHFETISHLYKIYQNVTLDFNRYPGHVCAAYLICGLLKEIKSSINTNQSHTATYLFLVSIETYLHITDVWWTEGRLEDWRDEYFVERVTQNVDLIDEFQLRSYDILHLPAISVIEDCCFFNILRQFAVDAGFTLSTLYKLDRIRDVRNQMGNQENLYKIFLELLSDKLPISPQLEANSLTVETQKPSESSTYSIDKINQFRKEFAKNEFLFLFENQLSEMEKNSTYVPDNSQPEINVYDLFQRLKQSTTFILPYQQYFCEILKNLLNARISVANNFVLEIYKNEHQLVHHLQNLPKVFFMESGDLLSDFYSKLFTQIENSDTWNNPYMLTTQLNGVLSYRISNSSFLFKVHVKSKQSIRDVIRAIDEISLSYVGNDNLRNIITDKCVDNYNKVFRFLLKMKWGLWTLENLRFPRHFRKHVLYGQANVVHLTFKRLALLRNWLMYSLQCCLSHFMTTVLHFMCHELNSKIKSAKNLTEIIIVHSSYIDKIADLCFQSKENENMCQGITQLLCLVCILKDEWRNIESSHDELDGSFVIDEICSLEKTYINCHAYLADVLLSEVYTNNNIQMAGLSAAFNCSRPY